MDWVHGRCDSTLLSFLLKGKQIISFCSLVPEIQINNNFALRKKYYSIGFNFFIIKNFNIGKKFCFATSPTNLLVLGVNIDLLLYFIVLVKRMLTRLY